MTDADIRAELRSIMAIPILDRYARKKIGMWTVARYSGLSKLTVYRCAWGDETVTRKSLDKIKYALATLAVGGSGKKHPRMRKHDPSDAAGVAPGPSTAKVLLSSGERHD